jgi:hypothetical protein
MVTRSVGRVLLLGVLLAARSGAASAQAASPELADYYRAISNYFEVGLDEVHIISEWRVAPEDIPVVFFLSRRAGISADATAAERVRGSSWLGLMRRYGVRVTAVHLPFAEGAELGPLASLYGRMEAIPQGAWNRLDLTDAEIRTLINVRMLSAALGVPPTRVLEAAAAAGSMVGVQRELGGG